MPTVLTLIGLGVVASLTYVAAALLFDMKESRKLLLRTHIHAKEQGTPSPFLQGSIRGWMKENSFLQAYLSSVQKTLDKTGENLSASAFTIRRLVFASVSLLGALAFYSITNIAFYLVFAFLVPILVFRLPLKSVKQKVKERELKLQMELPEYLDAFSLLLRTYSPYEATKRSINYSGSQLRPYVEKLITDIDLYPASDKPYYDFASSIDSADAKAFMIALRQSMKVDSKQANANIKDQLQNIDRLIEEAYEDLSIMKIGKFKKYEMALVFPLLIIILAFIGISVTQAFSSIM